MRQHVARTGDARHARRTEGTRGAGAPRPADEHRRGLPAPGGRRRPHAHRRARRLRRAARRPARSSASTSRAGCRWCRGTARSSSRCRSAPAVRCGWRTATSASATTSGTPRCPRPAASEQLLTLTSRILSQRLDRTKPLWEMWLVEGLEDGRFAIVAKTHHAMIDGVGGVDLLTALFDLAPDAERVAGEPWTPSSRRPARSGCWPRRPRRRPQPGAPRRPRRLAGGRPQGGGPRDDRRAGRARRRRRAAGVRRPAQPAQPASPARTAASRSCAPRWPTTRTVKAAFGATVNDVVLTAVSGALGRFLAARGEEVDGVRLKACVPVSVRSSDKSRRGRQRDHDHDRAAAGRHHRPGRPAQPGAAVDGAPQDQQAGRGRQGADLARERPAASRPRPGVAARLQQPDVQPAGHQRARSAGADLHARPRARGAGAAGVPRARAHAGHRDRQLQRQRDVRPARRRRRAARRRRAGRAPQGLPGRARRRPPRTRPGASPRAARRAGRRCPPRRAAAP